jgi:hypothetical protein
LRHFFRGSFIFMSRLGHRLRPRKPGRKPRTAAPAGQLKMEIKEMGKVSR